MYLSEAKELLIRLKLDHLNVLNWHIDSYYVIHHDMKWPTRESLTTEVGIIHAKSIKKKLNIKISTECELMVVDDCMPQVL